jgi:NADPH-dependent ferric siderophore reductase
VVSTNMRSTRARPATRRLLTLHVLRRERLSPHFARVTLGGGDIADFTPMGFDHWFRLCLPVPGGTLERVPDKLDTFSYLKFLTTAKATRPVLRNFSVRAFRPDGPEGPELDVDLVLHGSASDGGHGPAGPAATWAQNCSPGDVVGVLDEGTGYQLPDGVPHLRLVADETGVPAAANTLATLPDGVRAEVVLKVPDDTDRQDLRLPPGTQVTWLSRSGRPGTPGRLALAAATELPAPAGPWFGVAVGEQALASGLRRHWLAHGLPKDRLMFCGYWRAPRT